MKTNLTRRDFLRSTATAALAATALPALVPASALGRGGAVAANSRIGLAIIGAGPQGRGVLGGFLGQPNCRVVALADVMMSSREECRRQVNGHYKNEDCAVHADFRQVLARPDVDVVLIATPDHWHVPVAIAAANAGKDMYLEKPMGLSLAEDQMLRAAVQKHQRMFQFGTQQRSSREFQRAVELVRNGRIGKLRSINVWCSASRPGGPTTPIATPPGLDYDFWLGPAASKPYTDGKAFDNGPAWKTWWFNYDYALGFVAGWGVHPLDIALWGHPAMMTGAMEIEGKGVIPTTGACNTSVAWEVNFKFADGVAMRYRGVPNGYDTLSPMNDLADWRARYGKISDHGTAFEGTDGWVEVHRGGLRTFPESLAAEKLPEGGWRPPQSAHHQRNLLEAVQTRRPAICPIEDSVQADLLCHLSDIATRVDRKLRFDPVKEKFLGDAEANRRLALRPMRKPWNLG
jgi:predicted dehydrogenase